MLTVWGPFAFKVKGAKGVEGIGAQSHKAQRMFEALGDCATVPFNRDFTHTHTVSMTADNQPLITGTQSSCAQAVHTQKKWMLHDETLVASGDAGRSDHESSPACVQPPGQEVS